MKKAYVFLGPPLSGKSTKSLELKIPRFSVRKWFEPWRSSEKLPPIGSFLPDNMVYDAVESFLQQNKDAHSIAFDGFPGNRKQFLWLQETLKGRYETEIIYCTVRKKEAFRRAMDRKVCYNCDGGADPVNANRDNRCPQCKNVLGKRKDDTVEGFKKRWDSYFVREHEMAENDPVLIERILDVEPKNIRMDLHMHSTFSDGIYTPKELVLLCKDKNLKVIALTDHDTIDGLLEAEKETVKNGLKFIPGVELSALYNGRIIHVLGYGISTKNKALQKILKHNQDARTKFDEKVLDCLLMQGKISSECKNIYSNYVYDRRHGGWKLLNYLLMNQICNDGYEYFDLINRLNVGEIQYADVSTVVNSIKESGICIVAHPGTYGWDGETLFKNLKDLYEMKVDGFECYHPLNKEEDSFLIKQFCIRYDLIYTGGSDFHGNLNDRKLGYPECYFDSLLNTKFNEILY